MVSLGEADAQVCWTRAIETLTSRKNDIAGFAVASDERIEGLCLVLYGGRPDRAGRFCRSALLSKTAEPA